MLTKFLRVGFKLLSLIVVLQNKFVFACDPEIFNEHYESKIKLRADPDILALAKNEGSFRTQENFKIYLSERWFEEDGELKPWKHLFEPSEVQLLKEWFSLPTERLHNISALSLLQVPLGKGRIITKFEVQLMSEYMHYNRLRMHLWSQNSRLDSQNEQYTQALDLWKKEERLVKENLLKSVYRVIVVIPMLILSKNRNIQNMQEEFIFKLHALISTYDYRKGFEISSYIVPAINRHLRNFHRHSLRLNERLWVTNFDDLDNQSHGSILWDDESHYSESSSQDYQEMEPFHKAIYRYASEDLEYWNHIRDKIIRSDFYLNDSRDRFIFNKIFPEDFFQDSLSYVEIALILRISKQAVQMRIKNIRRRILDQDPGFGKDFLELLESGKKNKKKLVRTPKKTKKA